MQHTESKEDYLKVIYQLERQTGRPAATSAIADRLGVAPASVTGMVKRLAEAGLVEHRRYAGVRLTPIGRRVALDVIRHHRLIETYLANAMGLPWDKVHAEAHRLEHHISEELEERMDEILGHPERDPHGAVIPPREGEFDEPRYRSLAEVAAGERVIIREIEDDDPERLRYLDSLGLRPDVELVVREIAPYSGPITVELTGFRAHRPAPVAAAGSVAATGGAGSRVATATASGASAQKAPVKGSRPIVGVELARVIAVEAA